MIYDFFQTKKKFCVWKSSRDHVFKEQPENFKGIFNVSEHISKLLLWYIVFFFIYFFPACNTDEISRMFHASETAEAHKLTQHLA